MQRFLFFFGCFYLFVAPNFLIAQARTTTILSDGWKFQKGLCENAHQLNYDDTEWETVSVPHDWAIYGPFDKEIDKQSVAIVQNGETQATEKTGRTGALPYIGTAWYRKKFKLARESLTNKKILLLFEGAMSEPKVFLNGKKVGAWNYGYSYFYIDISEFAQENNVLAVELSNKEKSSRWYPGAGLYRKVSLIVKNQQHIKQWGTTITTTSITLEKAVVVVKTKIAGKNVVLKTSIRNDKGEEVAVTSLNNTLEDEFKQELIVNKPQLWSPETPYLYTAISKLYVNNELKDELITKFGVRSIEYNSAHGFRLNGKTRKFKGVCLHHDLGPLGTAVNKAALRRQLTILKDMGVDAVRSAHNMPSFEQLELCDEMGFLFLAESFDEWATPKVENGYHRFFKNDVEKDIVNLVEATKNHPCIVMWSSGNEVPDQWTTKGADWAQKLQDIFHREDPTRPVTVGMDQVKATMKSGFGALLDIPGLNYRTHLYEEAYATFPQKLILGSETASTVSSRGVYKFPVVKGSMKQYSDFQSSSYDLEYCSWSNIPEDDFVLQDDKPWVIGEFVWTGFDYLGEPTPYDEKWPSRSSYFGMIDLAGLPKDRFYLYRSRWNTQEETLHVLPHWNWEGREGEKTPVFVYTSYDSAELFVNGKSMGKRAKNRASKLERYRLMWMDVKYQPGSLKVVAFDDDGLPVAEKIVKTAGNPYRIVLHTDKQTLKSNGEDLSYVVVSVVDKYGVPCPTASNQLSFEVIGKGSFRAVCNGDATSLEMFHKPTMKLFSGKLVVTVQSSKKTGKLKLKVKGKGLKSADISMRVQ